jgi:predicted ribosomally synthesized peptide with SipW-like signal peptide
VGDRKEKRIMKKILMSLLVIALAVGGVAGASGAWFSDTETKVGNTFTAGIIDLGLEEEGGEAVATVEGEVNLKPCMTGYIKVRLTNLGNNPLEVWKHITDVVNTEGDPPVTDAEGKYYQEFPESVDYNISDYILYDMWIHDACPNGTGDNPELVFNPGMDQMIIDEELDGFAVTGGAQWRGIESYWIYLGVLDPDESMLVVQSYHLWSGTQTWAQSDVMTFTMEFYGQQTEGDPRPDPPQVGPDSRGELPGWGRDDGRKYPCGECLSDADCDDGNPCTDNTCEVGAGGLTECVSVSNNDPCDDGVFCNGQDTCDQDVCVPGGPDPCPGLLCDEDGDRCVECRGDDDCPDDGLFCTGDPVCEDGDCGLSGDPCSGEPGDICNEQMGACMDCADDDDCEAHQICVAGICQDV